jgi:diguanylate cyclase (GGDEF)-like protein
MGKYKTIILLFIILNIISFFISIKNYLFFHTFVETFALIVAVLIYIIGTRAYKHSQNTFLFFIGIGYFFVAALDFFHLSTYKGMGIFPEYSSNIPTQFWIAARYLESITILTATYFINRKFPVILTYLSYTLVTSAVVAAIMWLSLFPDCFLPDQGLTYFKILSEYIICAILVFSIYRIKSNNSKYDENIFNLIIISIIITIFSELSFTLYNDVYGFMNFLGHILKVVSFYLIFRGIIAKGIETPYEIISGKLKESAVTDSLTGLYNRFGFFNYTKVIEKKALKENLILGITVMDLDKFKTINDTYGHGYGDYVLKEFSNILKSNIRSEDIAARLGGDEFVILSSGKSEKDIIRLIERVRKMVDRFFNSNEKLKKLGVSFGTAFFKPNSSEDIDNILKIADKNMYKEKNKKECI